MAQRGVAPALPNMIKIETAGLIVLELLFFVWPLPRTISLRDFLLALTLVLFGYLVWNKRGLGKIPRDLFIPAALLIGLTAWMYAVAVFVSSETAWSLGEIRSQWWRALAALLAGILAALATRGNPSLKQNALAALFVALLAHILCVDFHAGWQWLAYGATERTVGLTAGPDISSYLTNILFGFALAELFCRALYKKRTLPFPSVVHYTVLVLAGLSVLVELTRNGIITLVLMLMVLGTLYLLERRNPRKKFSLAIGLSFMLIVAMTGLGLIATARQSVNLETLMATVPIAWDTEHNKAWQDPLKYALPKVPSGAPVDASTYLRIAWLKEGLILVRERPLGIGYGRSAFGHGIQAKYGIDAGHSHSGLLDIAIGIGIPGALLWTVLFVTLMVLTLRRWRAAPNYAAVLLLLVLVDYGVRGLLDSIQRDHMLQQFMFLAGLAAVMMVTETKTVGRNISAKKHG